MISQNLAPIWLPHWPACTCTISLIFKVGNLRSENSKHIKYKSSIVIWGQEERPCGFEAAQRLFPKMGSIWPDLARQDLSVPVFPWWRLGPLCPLSGSRQFGGEKAGKSEPAPEEWSRFFGAEHWPRPRTNCSAGRSDYDFTRSLG